MRRFIILLLLEIAAFAQLTPTRPSAGQLAPGGIDGYVLVKDSTQPSGMRWAVAPSGMTWPGVGIAQSTGSAWSSSLGLVFSVGIPGVDTNLATEKAIRTALAGVIPYSGATGDADLGTHGVRAAFFDSTGSGPLIIIGLHGATTDCATVPASNGCLFFDSANSDHTTRKDSAGVLHDLETPAGGVTWGGNSVVWQ